MGDAKEGRSRAMKNLSLQIEKYPRDLLKRFDAQESGSETAAKEDDEALELNLGLSLGGRFGIDKQKKLTRSSSIAGTLPIVRDDDAVVGRSVAYPYLMRTSSLPVETEEEWRKRKELQTLRRMEAKRRRTEKQRNSKTERDGCMDRSLDEDRREIEEPVDLNLRDKQQFVASYRFGTTVAPVFRLHNWGRQGVGGDGNVGAKGEGGFMGCNANLQGFLQPSLQGSMESQGGSSSGVSEMESRLVQGSSSCEARSPASNQSIHEQGNQDAAGSSGTKATEIGRTFRAQTVNPSRRLTSVENREGEIGTKAMENMPCVFTKGDGPDGRRVDGILYKYGKGEEVKIMCVCHGSFLSPAEFVKHGGGSDVAHPLRHIVVNPCSNSFL